MRAILTYHSIDASGSVISVAERVFRRHAEWMADSHVRVVSVEDLLALRPDEEAVAITFDDAFENFASVAWPILRDHDLPATVFVVTDHVGGSNDWDGRTEPGIPRLPVLDWDALARLTEEGATVGSHTRTHPRLAGAAPERVRDEIEGSADVMERRLGARPTGFAYPYGSVDGPAVGAARREYEWACTTELSGVGPDVEPHRLPRLDAFYFRDSGQLEDWGSPRFRARLAMRRALRRARSRVRQAVHA